MKLGDSLTNIVSGMGTPKDKLSHSRFVPTLLTKFELDSLYSSDWLSGKIIDAPADDMTREWRQWSGGRRQVSALLTEEKRLNVQQKVNHALKLAALHGGAGIIIGDGAEDPSKPLDLGGIKRNGVKYLTVLSRWELNATDLDRDPLSEWYGEPKQYQLSGGDRTAFLHPSRVVRFLGRPILEQSNWVDGWGHSILQRVYDAVRNANVAANNTASLTTEAKVDVFSIPGLNQNSIDPQYQRQIMARFGLANTAKSNQNALLLDAQEKWEQKQVSFTALVDVLNKLLEIASGAAGIPVTRLLGTSPKGLNATGQADFRSYYDMLSGRQENSLSPAISRLDEALIRSAIGSRPSGVAFEWRSLWQMTEAERAAIAVQRAQAAQIYGALGALPPSVMRGCVTNQLLETGEYPGMRELLEKAEAAGEKAEPIITKAELGGNEVGAAPTKVTKT